MPKFAGVELTPETIQRTREHFADIGRACIADARNGTTRVNDLESYIAWREQGIADDLAGKHDGTFAFLQRAYALQTGECLPLLSR